MATLTDTVIATATAMLKSIRTRTHTHTLKKIQMLQATTLTLKRAASSLYVSLLPLYITSANHEQPTHKHFSHKHTLSRKLKAGRDLGMMGVIIHVIGDAINNVGVIVSALVIWKAEGDARFYMDPAIGVFISIMIFCTAIPLTKRSGDILLQIAPEGIDVADVRDDLEKVGAFRPYRRRS